jgi:phage baseplate assembly protein W
MANIYNDLIGSGGLYPIQITQNSQGLTGWYPVKGDPKLIENNLFSLITYQIGQRFRQEEFGTRLEECLEEPNTQALAYLVDEFLKSAINEYENRIKYVSSSISRNGSKLNIEFTYRLKSNNSSRVATVTYDTEI